MPKVTIGRINDLGDAARSLEVLARALEKQATDLEAEMSSEIAAAIAAIPAGGGGSGTGPAGPPGPAGAPGAAGAAGAAGATGATGPAGTSADSPDTPAAVPALADDEFGGTKYPAEVALDTGGTRFASATPWTWVNQGGAVASIVRSWLKIVATGTSANIRMVTQPVPGGSAWRVEAKIHLLAPSGGNSTAGIVLRESATGKITILCVWGQGANGPLDTAKLGIFNYTSPSVFSSQVINLTTTRQPDYFAVEYDGTNYMFDLGVDTIIPERFATVAKAAFFTTAADQIGLGVDSNGLQATLACDWWRQTA